MAHWSSCAVHNAPALPVGPCDCDGSAPDAKTARAHRARPPIERFDKYWIPEPNSGCWLWFGATAGNGYGSFYNGDRMVSAHSFSYGHHVGVVPDGLELDHLCRMRCCVNPAYLEPVTRRENTKRGTAGHHMRGKTHCSKGHALDDVNTYWRSNGNRSCRICDRLKMRRLRAKWRVDGRPEFACAS